MLATVLGECRISLGDDGVTIIIPAGNDMAERMIRDESAIGIIRRAFAAATGRETGVTVTTAGAARSAEKPAGEPQSSSPDDPVLKSLQRHLGGEVVRPRGGR